MNDTAATRSAEPEQLLAQSGAIREGHFVLDSGRHARRYCQTVGAVADPEVGESLLDAVAEPWVATPVEAVLGANEAGSVMAYGLARRLGARAVFARSTTDGAYRVLGGALGGARVLVTDDVTTTGGTARALIDAVRTAGGEAHGVALLASKGLFTVDLGVPTTVTAELGGFDAVAAADCPACARGEPVTPK